MSIVLSNDAHVLLTSLFFMEGGVFTPPGKDSENELTKKASDALLELVDKGYVQRLDRALTEGPRASYVRTSKFYKKRSRKFLEEHGHWPLVEKKRQQPNYGVRALPVRFLMQAVTVLVTNYGLREAKENRDATINGFVNHLSGLLLFNDEQRADVQAFMERNNNIFNLDATSNIVPLK